MKLSVCGTQPAVGLPRFLSLACLLVAAQFLFSCSIPNLEKPECNASRDIVKEFYSFHFGNDMKFSRDNLKRREEFLTPAFAASLANIDSAGDIFTTNSDDFPKTFRIGVCEVVSQNETNFSVLLFWRDDVRSEQREIKVETVKNSGKWLINKVNN